MLTRSVKFTPTPGEVYRCQLLSWLELLSSVVSLGPNSWILLVTSFTVKLLIYASSYVERFLHMFLASVTYCTSFSGVFSVSINFHLYLRSQFAQFFILFFQPQPICVLTHVLLTAYHRFGKVSLITVVFNQISKDNCYVSTNIYCI